jgi:hypothetical protein
MDIKRTWKKSQKDAETTKWTQTGFQKFKNETKAIIKRETYEMKPGQGKKEEFNKDMENLRKINWTEILVINVT